LAVRSGSNGIVEPCAAGGSVIGLRKMTVPSPYRVKIGAWAAA
jgi:hypothetical protein